MRVVTGGTGDGSLMIEREFGMNTFLRPDIHRMGHAVGHRVAVPAKANDILDEKTTRPDRFGVVAMKTPGRAIHKGVRILSSCSYARRQDDQEDQEDQEDQATKPDPFNSF